MKTNILVIDDTRDNLRLLQSILTEQGYLVRPVSVGARAIAGAQSKPPDLILLDIMMPEMDGYAVCEALKADERTRDIPVIFLSALNDTFDKIKAFSAGGVDYITKPFQPEEVLARVKTHVTLRNLQKQLQQHNRQLQQTNAQLTREIAERKHAEEELQHARDAALKAKEEAEAAQRASEAANRAKSTFLANMSHELRSPLNAILGFTQVMARSQSLPSEHQEHVGIIRRSGEHLLTLINQVLELSKIEAGRITLNLTTVDLHQLLFDVQDMFALRAETKGLQLVFEHDENIPQYIRTDDVRLRQVLINLLNNAIKFTEKGDVQLSVTAKQVSVPLEKPDTDNRLLNTDYGLLFTVKDTGPGIAPDEIETVFEAFKQTDTGRQSQEGTGLGLPISRKFVQLMGGDMQVKSEVGHGAIFTFDIQCDVVDASAHGPSSIINRVIALEPGQRAAGGGPFRLLIVDDTPDNRRLLVVLLEPFGFDLREAANGQEAVDVWKEWEPHLIWMDMRMPVVDGYEAIKNIKAAEAANAEAQTPTIIIALTASSFEEERLKILATGCDDYLRKPFHDAELFELLSKHLGLKVVYEEHGKGAESREQGAQHEALIPEALSALPAEWLTILRQGAQEANPALLFEVIEQIRKRDATVADALAQLTDNFEYEGILRVIPPTGRGGAE